LQNNGGNDLTISDDGPLSFESLGNGAGYTVTVLTPRRLLVTNADGTIMGANVTNIAVAGTAPRAHAEPLSA
jgi:hypothetical protein